MNRNAQENCNGIKNTELTMAQDRDGGAAAMSYLTSHFSEPSRVARKKDALRLVIVNHFYDQDIEAFLKSDFDCTIWILHWSHINGIRQYFHPEPGLDKSYNDPGVQRQIERATRHFVIPAVSYILAITHAEAVLCPSDIFFWLRPFISEFKRRGIKVFVQDKEGTLSPGSMTTEHLARCMSLYPPMADFYYSWGRIHRDAWTQAGLNPNVIKIFGMPRSDILMRSTTYNAIPGLGLTTGRRIVTCFTYETDVYLTAGTSEREIGRPWHQMRREMHRAITDLAELWPMVTFVVKLHPQSYERDQIAAELNPLPHNVLLFEGAATAAALINVSEFVIGFQSTALIEAMINKKPILYCNWSVNIAKFKEFLIPIYDSGCTLISSGTDLVETAGAYLSQIRSVEEPEIQRRRRFAEDYFHNTDGNTAGRILVDVARRVRSNNGILYSGLTFIKSIFFSRR